MAVIRPFRAIRPKKEFAQEVISLPYDVMNRKEAAAMAEGKAYNFLHICRAEIDIPDAQEETQEVYDKAKANILKFMEDGVLIQEEEPLIYVYREIMDGRVQTGIFACASVDDYENNVIKKHEHTRKAKEIDRINHFDTCNANTEPVFLTYRDDKRLRLIIEGWAENHEPEYDVTADDGVRHILWPVTDNNTQEMIISLFDEIPSLYIADGHHRSASAYNVGLKRRETFPDYTGDEEFNFFMAAVFPANDLFIYDYNRVVADLNGYTKEEFIEKIKDAGFDVEEMGTDIYHPEKKSVFAMFLEGKWYRLAAKEEIIPDDVIESLDVAVLQNSLLNPVLGIEDPRTDKRIDFIGGIRGLEELEKRTNEDMKVAFAVYPVAIEDLLSVSDAGLVMPPKSTWFEPKLGSGLLIHSLD